MFRRFYTPERYGPGCYRIIEQINLEELYRKYFTKGCSAYHPRMMLQILVYAFA